MIFGNDDTFKTCTIIKANPTTLTCDIIKTEGGIIYDVPIANTTGGIMSTDVNWSKNINGAIGYYAYIDGQPYLLGTLPHTFKYDKKVTTNATDFEIGGENKTTYGSSQGFSYGGTEGTDYQPSDKMLATDGSARILFMDEGGLQLEASPMSKIIMGSGMDFMKIVCRSFDIYTDFGRLSFTHGSSGRTGLVIQGGASYGDETQPGKGTNTVFMYLGDTEGAPDMRFGVRVGTSGDGDFGAFALGNDGKLFFTSSKDSHTMIGGDKHELIDKNVYYEIKENYQQKVKKDFILEIEKNKKETILENSELTVTKDEVRQIIGESRNTYGESVGVNVGEDIVFNISGTFQINCSNYVCNYDVGESVTDGDLNHVINGNRRTKINGSDTLICQSLNISKG